VRTVHLLKGRTLGIVGCGRIGSRVLRMAAGLGMKSLVCDPYLSAERRRELGIETVPLERALRDADAVTLHAPLNDETRGIVNRRTLSLMKRSAVLVNTARGGLVVEEDLAAALRDGTIAGAALDVYTHEPPGREHPFFGAPNLLLTPHLSWYSEESGWSIREKILEDIVRYLEGRPPRFTVNEDVDRALGPGKVYRD